MSATGAVKFRNDINGMRAIAVAAVVLYHFNVGWLTGGFVGVDVFFVISGFLMTGIIFPQVENNRFNLLKFYLARAQRIVPALAAVCLTVLVVGWFTLLPADYKVLSGHAAGALSFLSNILFARESGYFDAAPVDKWLLHTWSLSVEWQFYLLYPIVAMLALPRLSRRAAGYLIVAGCVSSLFLAMYATSKWPTQAFYLLPTRAWEMLAGGIVYLFPLQLTSGRAKGVESCGLLLILFSCLYFSHADAWPGHLATIPVAGAMAMLWAHRNDSVFTSNQASAFLGKISYSVYLWHWPIVVAVNYYGLARQPGWATVGVVSSILCGWVSYMLIESRVTNGRSQWSSKRAATLRIAAVPIGLLVFCCFIFRFDGVPGHIRAINNSERVQFIASYHRLHENGLGKFYRQECDFYNWDTKQAKSSIDASCTLAGGPGTAFLWGDSHAQALAEGMKQLLGAKNISQVATSGCPPSFDGKTKSPIQNNCRESVRFALAEIARLQPETVVLAQRDGHLETDWDALASLLHDKGVKRVILIGPAPAWVPELPVLVARKHWLDKSEFIDDGIHTATIADSAAMAEKARKSTQYEFISMVDLLCPDGHACRVFLPGTRNLTAVDYGHLSPSGSTYVVDKLLRAKITY